jgi:hypothetical protein
MLGNILPVDQPINSLQQDQPTSSLVAADISIDESPSTDNTSIEEKKIAWVKIMRSKFCVRPEFPTTNELLNPDFTLNQA